MIMRYMKVEVYRLRRWSVVTLAD